MPSSAEIPSSRHFQIQTVSNGVYAAIHKDGGWAICNSGIIDLGEKTIVFDSGLTPKAARELKAAAEILTGRAVDYIVNSHYHKDHIRGNQVFEDSMIISTEKTQTLIGEKGIAEVESDKIDTSKQLDDIKRLAQRRDPRIQEYVKLFLPYWQGINNSLKVIELRIPNMPFNDRHILSGIKRSAMLVDVGEGHSENDCILYVPEEKVVFCGDLLFIGCHPYMGESNPEEWISILNHIKELDVNTCVPGHGEIGSSENLDIMIAYIQEIVALVKNNIKSGGDVEEVVRNPVPTQFRKWILSMPFYEANIRFLHERIHSG